MSRLIDKYATIKALHEDPVGALITGMYNVDGWLEKREEVPAIPLAWIDSYIQTCEIFDLRANAPASNVIKTMVKIWEQENQITTMVKNMGTGNPEPWKGERCETD